MTEEERFQKFVDGLEQLSLKHGVIVEVTGGVYMLDLPLKQVSYTRDSSSGDLHADVVLDRADRLERVGLIAEREAFVAEYGEEHRPLITSCLKFLNEEESKWGLKKPIDRQAYVDAIVVSARKK